MLKSLEINGLLTRQKQFSLVFQNDVNIITGTNGAGKTTLLTILWYLISGNLIQLFSKIKFDSLVLKTDKLSFSITKIEKNQANIKLKYTLYQADNIDINFDIQDASLVKHLSTLCLSLSLSETESSLFFPSYREIDGDLSKNLTSTKHKLIASISSKDIKRIFSAHHTKLEKLTQEIFPFEIDSIDTLSSGEKQMLGFLCYNAWINESIFLIDEPEISLHIDWQRCLFQYLLSQQTNNQFIVATHSPCIYAQFPDKELRLD